MTDLLREICKPVSKLDFRAYLIIESLSVFGLWSGKSWKVGILFFAKDRQVLFQLVETGKKPGSH